MRNVIVLFLLILGSIGCADKVAPEEQGTTSTLQAKEWIDGKWDLVGISGGYVSVQPNPNPPAPGPKEFVLQLTMKNGRMIVVDKGKKTIQVGFEIVQTAYGLRFKTNVPPQDDRWYLRDSGLKISRNKLFLDTGIAHDSFGYYFERIE